MKNTSLKFIIFLLFLHTSTNFGYEVDSLKYSYYRLDLQGSPIFEENLPVRDEGSYRIKVNLKPRKTAIIVMDPWIDMTHNHLNQYFGSITKHKIIPLVKRSIETGHLVVFLTNNPLYVRYCTKIDPDLIDLVDNQKTFLLYHQNYNSSKFSDWLRVRNIDTLVYTGYASNQCIIGRQLGMIMMKPYGFRLFFIPEASAAVELVNTWDNQLIHKVTTTIISQWIGAIIHWDDLIEKQ